MSAPAENQAIAAIVGRVLQISTLDAGSARRGEHDNWNSLKHIEIVFQIEEEFEVQFGEDDIAGLTDVASIRAAVVRARGC